jgi:tetratricopeptide (TPR) repeat protein
MGPESFATRWWNAVRPLPSEQDIDPALLAQKRKQRNLIRFTLLIVALSGSGWYAFDYIDRAPERARSAFGRGMALMGPKSYAEAIQAFDRAISIWPQLPEAYLNRGIAYYQLGQAGRALEEFDQAAALDPTLTRAYDERGRIFLERGETSKAIEQFSKSLSIKPTTDGYYARGLAYESLSAHQKAIDDYDKAITELVDAPYAYRARAMARANLGDHDGAKADRDKALQIERPGAKLSASP